MNQKLLTCAAIAVALISATTLYAQTPTPAEKTNAATAQAAAEAKSKQIEDKLDMELSNKPTATPAATESTDADIPAAIPPAEDPLIDQYKLKKDKNFKSVEFELAKELALHRSSAALAEQETKLYDAALVNLSTALGNISEPQKEETYFEYQEDPETGEFVVVLIKDSYVKAERGDLCQVGTQVHLRTSIQDEFTAKLAEIAPVTPVTPANQADATTAPSADAAALIAKTPKAPTTITQIECYNDERPTYSQRLVN